jgi:hypothetical protein
MRPISIIATAALALLAAACSTSSSSSAPNAADSASTQLVAYSQCMRTHGVPKFPDPSNGAPPKADAGQLGVSTTQLQIAQGDCQHLLPTGGSLQQQGQQCMLAGNCPPALVAQMLTADRKFARCMRSHGVPNWPDPSIDPEGRPVFNLTTVGITHSQTHSPPIQNKLAECNRIDPAAAGLESN